MARRAEKDIAPLIAGTGIIAPAPIEVELPTYSGSLGGLFICIRDGKVDLLGVALGPICETYYKYLIENADRNLDEAAAGLAALAWLVERKAWLLLPIEEEPEALDEPAELPAPIVGELGPAMEVLRSGEEARELLFFRPIEAGPDPYELPFSISEVTADDLARALQNVLARANPDPPIPVDEEPWSLSRQIEIVLRSLSPQWTSLEMLLVPPYTRSEAVCWFLALLELIRLGQAKVRLHDGDAQFALGGIR